MSHLSVHNLCKIYPSAAQAAVDNISFSVESGHILALLGPNGAGKTTVIKCIAGLVLPTQGEIRVLDIPLATAQRQAVSHIGAVLEGTRNLYWRLSAWENLLYFGGIRLVSSRKLRQRADELLTLMGLEEQKHVEVRRFSRGMQQKLAIAVALLHEPSLLLLDEPTLGLDVEAARTLERTVRELAQQRGIAIVLTTHQMDLAERLADEIFVMDGGKQLAYAPTQALLKAYDLHRQSVVVQLMSALSEEQAGRLLALLPSLSIENQGSHSATLQWTVERQSDLTLLLANLDQMQVQVDSVVYQKARLEDVFLSLTRNGGT
ncbi:ATP-binding cassette domain-containing protein [bacterium]|nr:ATP-binding cassette domain-containing protein [bacterium]